jgi:hypothetical protein
VGKAAREEVRLDRSGDNVEVGVGPDVVEAELMNLAKQRLAAARVTWRCSLASLDRPA